MASKERRQSGQTSLSVDLPPVGVMNIHANISMIGAPSWGPPWALPLEL